MTRAPTTKLDMYLELERLALELDAQAERVREILDHVWLELSDVDHEFLNKRHVEYGG